MSSSLIHFNGQVIFECGKFSCFDFLFFPPALAIKETHSAKKVISFSVSFKALLIVKIFSSELQV